MQTRYLIVLEDGSFQGASVTNDTGLPVPLTIDQLAAVCPTINAAAIVAVEQRDVAHAAEIADLLAAHANAIATLKAEHAAALAAEASPSILATLDEAFETHVPEDLRAQFETAWVTVRNLLQAGKIGRAAAFVRALPVPAELEPAREQIATMIDGGA